MKHVYALVALMMVGTSAYAMDLPSLQFPVAGQWAVAMVEKACKVEFSADYTGTITEINGGVLYKVMNKSGKVVAAATAESTSIFAHKNCL